MKLKHRSDIHTEDDMPAYTGSINDLQENILRLETPCRYSLKNTVTQDNLKEAEEKLRVLMETENHIRHVRHGVEQNIRQYKMSRAILEINKK
jgi:uncharacterized protein YajQ (UPF0234 family)